MLLFQHLPVTLCINYLLWTLFSLVAITTAAPGAPLSLRSPENLPNLKPRGYPDVIKSFLKEIKKQLPPDLSQSSDPSDYPVGHRLKKLVYNFKSRCNGETQTIELDSKVIESSKFYKDYIGIVKGPSGATQVRARISEKQAIRFLQGARLQESANSPGVEELVGYFYEPNKKQAVVLYKWDSEHRNTPTYIGDLRKNLRNYETYITLLETVSTLDKQGIYPLDIKPRNVMIGPPLVYYRPRAHDKLSWLTNFETAIRYDAKMAHVEAETDYKHKSAYVGSEYYAPQEVVWGEKTWKPIDVVMFELGMLAIKLVTPMFEYTNKNIWVELVQQRHVSKDAAEQILVKHGVNSILASQLSRVLCSSGRLGIDAFLTEMKGMGNSGWDFDRLGPGGVSVHLPSIVR